MTEYALGRLVTCQHQRPRPSVATPRSVNLGPVILYQRRQSLGAEPETPTAIEASRAAEIYRVAASTWLWWSLELGTMITGPAYTRPIA